MQIVTSTLQQFFQLVDFSFRNAQLNTPTYWEMFAKQVPSKTEKNVYPWLAQIPGLREWVGPRIAHNLVTRNYELTNRKFEDSIEIDRDKLADDTYGFFGDVASTLGQRVAEFPDEQLATLLEAGTSTVCWDGQNFFDTAHPVNPDNSALSTFSNNLVGSTYNLSTDPRAVYRLVRSAMMKFKRDDGKPLGIVGNLLMVPPDWEGAGKDAVEAVTITHPLLTSGNPTAAGTPSNVFQGTAKLVVNQWLTKQDAAYLFCTTKGIMPLLYQLREAANFVPRVDPTSDNVFRLNKFEWGCDMRAAFGFTFPFLVVRFAAT